MPDKRLNSQAQELVLQLTDYFKLEKANGASLISVNSVYHRVSDALGICTVLVGTIKKRKELDPVLSSPGKKRPRRKIKTADLSEPTKMEVRNVLYNMYKDGNTCEFNAIQQNWGKAKDYYDKHIGRDGYGDQQVLNMWSENIKSTYFRLL